MEKKISSRLSRLKLIIVLMVSVCFLSVLAMPNKNEEPINSPVVSIEEAGGVKAGNVREEMTASEKQREQESKAAFIDAYQVFMNPRCMNCHPSGDVPLQGDDSHLHTQGVKRGPDGKGLYALKCKNCHQDSQIPGEHMPPGNPTWSLPPANMKMVFQGKSPGELAMHFKDNKFTGFKNFAKDMVHHVEFEPLVLHSWAYGTPPPMSHKEFVAKVKEWIEKGAEVPDK